MSQIFAVILCAFSVSAQYPSLYRPILPLPYPPRRCAVGGRFQCGGIGQCLPQPSLCGGAANQCRVGFCQNGFNGGRLCRPQTHFRCGTTNSCLPRNLMCNGFNDCGDMSDERQCVPLGGVGGFQPQMPNYGGFGFVQPQLPPYGGFGAVQPYQPALPTVTCNVREFACRTVNPYNPTTAVIEKCIPDLYRCNAHRDCSDGSDEINCNSPIRPNCDRNRSYQCNSGQCVPLNGRPIQCDGTVDCTDRSDEEGCGQLRN